jgi:hypothetical protein
VRRVLQITVVLALGLATAGGRGADASVTGAPPSPTKEGSCGSYGTSVEFVSSPSEAARLAKKEQKLVFVLHVSGHFEDPAFT